MIVLYEVEVDAVFRQSFLMIAFEKEPTMVLEEFRFNDHDTFQPGFFNLNIHSLPRLRILC